MRNNTPPRTKHPIGIINATIDDPKNPINENAVITGVVGNNKYAAIVSMIFIVLRVSFANIIIDFI